MAKAREPKTDGETGQPAVAMVLTEGSGEGSAHGGASKPTEQTGQVKFDESMAGHTSFKAGGKAAALVTVESLAELKIALQAVDEAGVPSMVLGNGSNTLFKDSGYDGVVIKLGAYFGTVGFDHVFYGADSIHRRHWDDAEGLEREWGHEGEPVLVTCGASMLLSTIARFLLEENLAGFEFASGIPGSLGGAVFMNAGAYGGEMKDILVCAHAVSRDGREEKIFTAQELELSYRHSALMDNGYIVTSAMLRLRRGDHDAIAARMKELMEQRNSKQPVQYPSAGSTFKRPEGYFAGKLIQDAGLKGVAVGGAQVSTLHSGFIINRGGATATDILDLIALVQNTVHDKFGVRLEPEVRIIG